MMPPSPSVIKLVVEVTNTSTPASVTQVSHLRVCRRNFVSPRILKGNVRINFFLISNRPILNSKFQMSRKGPREPHEGCYSL